MIEQRVTSRWDFVITTSGEVGSLAMDPPPSDRATPEGRLVAWGSACLRFFKRRGAHRRPSVSDAPPAAGEGHHRFPNHRDARGGCGHSEKQTSRSTYTATRQEDPRGVLLPRSRPPRLEGLDAAYFPPPNPVIRSIRTTEAHAGSEARVFLELSQDAPYEVMPDKDGLKIVFHKAFRRRRPSAGCLPFQGSKRRRPSRRLRQRR